MKKTIITLIVLAVATALIVGVLGVGLPQTKNFDSETAVMADGKIYVVQNGMLSSSIYGIDVEGKLDSVYNESNRFGTRTIERISHDGTNLYFVRRTAQPENRMLLETVEKAPGVGASLVGRFTTDSTRIIGMTAPSFITIAHNDVRKGIAVLDGNNGTELVSFAPQNNKFVLSANYLATGDAVVAQLTDGSAVKWDRTGIYPDSQSFGIPPTIPQSFSIPFGKRLQCQRVVLGVIFAVYAAIGLLILLGSRLRLVNRISLRIATVCSVSILLCTSVLGAVLVTWDTVQRVNATTVATMEATARLASTISNLDPRAISEEGFAATQEYLAFRSILADTNADLIKADGGIAISPKIPTTARAAQYYNEHMMRLVDSAMTGKGDSQLIIRRGKPVSFAASPVMANGVTVGVLMVEGQTVQVISRMLVNILLVLVVSAGVMVIVWLVLSAVMLRVMRPLGDLTTQLNALAIGDTKLPQLAGGQGELDVMAQALQDVCLNLSIRSYEMNSTIESYSRFIPRGLTQLLDRASVMEVGVGDINSHEGNVAMLSVSNRQAARSALSDADYVHFVNNCFAAVDDNAAQHGGYLLSAGFELDSVKVYYKSKASQALASGLALLGEAANRDRWATSQRPHFLGIFHRTTFLHGMAGTTHQVFPFLSSSEMDFLNSYATRLSDAGVHIAMTHMFQSQCDEGCNTRYIGFVTDPDSGTSYKLYEVLDAYPELERNLRIRYDDRLQEGIQLFYRRDFYLARNLFSSLLRACPADGIVRWYLFACEHFFNCEAISQDDNVYQLFGVEP